MEAIKVSSIGIQGSLVRRKRGKGQLWNIAGATGENWKDSKRLKGGQESGRKFGVVFGGGGT